MIIVISSDKAPKQEPSYINKMFANGLDLFHLRKYEMGDVELKMFVEKIDRPYRERLVLHHQHHLAKEWGITRLHFGADARNRAADLPYRSAFLLSTSVHCIRDFNRLEDHWSYAFLSPVFTSISKRGYGKNANVFHSLIDREKSNIQLIGLGGIHCGNCEEVLKKGVDGIALMGGVWQNQHPLNAFIDVKRKTDRFKHSRL